MNLPKRTQQLCARANTDLYPFFALLQRIGNQRPGFDGFRVLELSANDYFLKFAVIKRTNNVPHRAGLMFKPEIEGEAGHVLCVS